MKAIFINLVALAASALAQYQVNSADAQYVVNGNEGTPTELAITALGVGDAPVLSIRTASSTPRTATLYMGGATTVTPSAGGLVLPDGQIVNLEIGTVLPTPVASVGATTTPITFVGPVIALDLRTRIATQVIVENPTTPIGFSLSGPSELHICGLSPTNLIATPGQTSVRLDWTIRDPNEIGGRVARLDPGEDPNVFSNWDNVGGNLVAGTTSFVVSGLMAGATYRFKVRSIVPCGYTPFSSAVVVNVSCSTPTAPTGLNATATGFSSVALTWQDLATNETGYRVSRLDPGEDPNIQANWDQVGGAVSLPAGTQGLNDFGLQPNSTYLYRVRAENFCGFSSFSNYATVTTPCVSPTPPTNFAAASVGSTSMNLVWTDLATDEVEYRVSQLDPGEDPGNPQLWDNIGGALPPNSTTLAVTGLQPGQTYRFRVRAIGVFNSTCPAPQVGPLLVTTATCPPAPPAPFNCVATRQGNTPAVDPILVTWSYSGPPISGFRVSRLPPGGDENDPNAWNNVGGDLAPTTFSFTDTAATGLTRGGTWNYRVRAFIDGPCGRIYSAHSNSDPANP